MQTSSLKALKSIAKSGGVNLRHNSDIREKISKEKVTKTIEIDKIKVNPLQPRTLFDKDKLDSLIGDIRENGLRYPVELIRDGDDYIIISGERRYRACKQIGYRDISAFILPFGKSDLQKLFYYALEENLQRANLTPIEIAESIKNAVDKGIDTQENIGKKLGFPTSKTSKLVKLTKLSERVKDELINLDKFDFEFVGKFVEVDDVEVQYALFKMYADGVSREHIIESIEKYKQSKREPDLFSEKEDEDLENEPEGFEIFTPDSEVLDLTSTKEDVKSDESEEEIETLDLSDEEEPSEDEKEATIEKAEEIAKEIVESKKNEKSFLDSLGVEYEEYEESIWFGYRDHIILNVDKTDEHGYVKVQLDREKVNSPEARELITNDLLKAIIPVLKKRNLINLK